MDSIREALQKFLWSGFNDVAEMPPEQITGCKPGAVYRVTPHNLSVADACAISLSTHGNQNKNYATEDSVECTAYIFCQQYRRVVEGR